MAKPKIYCDNAERDAEGYIRCHVNGEYCGIVKFCKMYGWWEQLPAASFCALRKEEKDGKTVHPNS